MLNRPIDRLKSALVRPLPFSSWLGALNFLLLQWMCMRLAYFVDEQRQVFKWGLIWRLPLTGWTAFEVPPKGRTIFISSPYTEGNREENVRLQIEAMHRLMDLGWAPFVPLLSHYAEAIKNRPYEEWIDLDLVWLRQCDVYLRLDSDLPSKGADTEEAEAISLNKPCLYGLESVPHADLFAHITPQN